jgi:membrane protease subunit HflC
MAFKPTDQFKPPYDDHDHDHNELGEHVHAPLAPPACPTCGRGWALVLAVVVLAAAGITASRSVFFVDETEYGYVTQFGEPVRFCMHAGLGLKWPWQTLWRFDKRLQIYEPAGREMLTEDKENLNISWYVCWRIPGHAFLARSLSPAKPAADQQAEIERAAEVYARRFMQTVGTPQSAQLRLEERIQAAIAAEVGRLRLGQLVSLDPQALQLEAMIARITATVRPMAAEQFGIELVDLRLKRFNYPEAVKPAVFAEIRSERQRVATQYRAEGASQKIKIESLANLQRDQILAHAKREAARIRGEGEAKAIEISNAAHNKNPAFYELLKTLETYAVILDEQTTIVFAADSPLLKLLTRGLPPLKEADPHAPQGTAPPATGPQDTMASGRQPLSKARPVLPLPATPVRAQEASQ